MRVRMRRRLRVIQARLGGVGGIGLVALAERPPGPGGWAGRRAWWGRMRPRLSQAMRE